MGFGVKKSQTGSHKRDIPCRNGRQSISILSRRQVFLHCRVSIHPEMYNPLEFGGATSSVIKKYLVIIQGYVFLFEFLLEFLYKNICCG